MRLLVYVGAAFVLLQYVGAVVVWVDGKRRNLEEPWEYPLAIMVLVVFGWVLFFMYWHRRDTLPKSADVDTDFETVEASLAGDETLTWTVDMDGSATVFRRTAYGINTAGRVLWWGVFVTAPLVIFALGVFVSGEAFAAYAYVLLCAALMARSYARRTTQFAISVDRESATITVVRHGARNAEREQEFDIADLRAVRLLRADDHVIVRCRYRSPLLPRPSGFLVPTERLEPVVEVLETNGVTVRRSEREAVGSNRTDRAVWIRPLIGTVTLILIPAVAVLL